MSRQVKVFIRKIIIFGIVFLGFDLLVPYSCLTFINPYSAQYRYEMKPAEVLVLGDSRSAFSFDTKVFSENGLSAYNSSSSGRYFKFHYYYYKKYKKKCGIPKAVVVAVPFFIFRFSTSERYLRWLQTPEDLTSDYFSFDSFYRTHFFKYREELKRIPGLFFDVMKGDKKERVVMRAGFVGKNGGKDLVGVHQMEKYEMYSEGYVTDGFSRKDNINKSPDYKYIKKFFVELEKDGVILLLADVPEYYQSQETLRNKHIFYSELEQEIEGYQNITFIKQQNVDVIDKFDKSLFYDGGYGNYNSHLSYKGSQLYSDYIAKFIKNLLIRD